MKRTKKAAVKLSDHTPMTYLLCALCQSRRHGEALVGLAPPKQSSEPPQIET